MPAWLERCVQHASRGYAVLACIPAQVGSLYWRQLVWPRATAIVSLSPRPKFGHVLEADDPKRKLKAGDIVTSGHPCDIAVVAFGVAQAKMLEVWSDAGVVVAPVRELATDDSGMSAGT